MIDLTFLKALREKLKGGNARSIHLNVLPGKFATRLDFAHLSYIQPGLAEKFLETILTKSSFNFPISFDGVDLSSISIDEQKRLGLLSKRLNSIHIENEDNFKEHGIKTFGFGYPILVKPLKNDPTKIIKAPLFIWQLEIIKATNKVNSWSIFRNRTKTENGKIVEDEIHAVALNEVLLAFLKSDENVSITPLDIELDETLDREKISAECHRILKALNSITDANLIAKLDEPIETLPDAASFASLASNKAWIYFGGVFGLYRTQKESIITDIDELIQRHGEFDFEDLKVESLTSTPYSAIDTDPSQQEILSSLGVAQKQIIQGPPGTGKSQSLTALISNALANNLKCLVVCEKKTALDVIKNNLTKKNGQLGALAAVIEDINKDRDAIVNSARERMANLLPSAHFNVTNYKSILENLDSIAKEINLHHQQLDKKIYQGKSWTELVGEFLKRDKIADHSLLKNKLDFQQFSFQKDENELAEIVKKIKTARTLFSEVNQLDHPLDMLSDEIFKEGNPKAIQLRLEQLTNETLENLKSLNDDLEKQISLYKTWLDNHYKEHYDHVKTRVLECKSFATNAHKQYGASFFKNDELTKIKIKIFSLVSGRFKSIRAKRDYLINQVTQIKSLHQSFAYFKHDYQETNGQSDLSIYVENVTNLSVAADSWYDNISKVKEAHELELSFVNSHTLFDKKDTLKLTESAFGAVIAKLIREKIIKRPFSDSDSHPEKIVEVKKLHSEFHEISKHLEQFREYYDWRKFYLDLKPNQRSVIKAIIEVKCEQWEATFESWYYHWLLALGENINLPRDEEKIKELVSLKEQLSRKQIESIIHDWSVKQKKSVRESDIKGISPNSLFNKRGSRGERRNSLRKILKTNFQLFTDLFPVVMVSPTVCSSIIPLKEGIFDLVIFDEASQLRIEDTFAALIRGGIKIVSGDSQQMPPSSYFQGGNTLLNPADDETEEELADEQKESSTQKINSSIDLAESESLLVYAENCGYKQSYLKIHYRSQHPFLIDFSNHAFYGKRLIPLPARAEYKPVQFIEVNGLYEDQGNRDEARQVVDILLHHIKPFANGKYPSVGVATFNLYQRNLILEEITKVRQLKTEYDRKIAELGSDLFVKNLENIQGDERDVMIISTTFGKKSDGSFKQNFGPILQRNGYKLLNVIITRAKSRVYLCTSIPNENIMQYSSLLQQFRNNGRAVFYSYLAYAKAVSENNLELRDAILAQLYENSDSKTYDVEFDSLGSESPFEEEVYYRLAEKIGQERVKQQYKVGGFRIDMVVKSKITGIPTIAIECDGAKYHGSNEAYAWDMFRESIIKPYGFVFYRIWSTNWFRSPEKELRKLVEFIQGLDANEKQDQTIEIESFYVDEKIIPVTSRPETKMKVTLDSLVTVKSPEGKIIKVKFSKVQSTFTTKQVTNGIVTVYEKSPLAMAIIGRSEGETCPLGMLELYYEIQKVE
jgi:very-short-patch-repair endonuclease